MEDIIKVEGVAKGYGKHQVLQNLDIAIKKGECFTLLGPSGCGKTVLIRLIAGHEVPDEGKIIIDETVVADSASGEYIPPERRGLGIVFQDYAVWPHMTVYENIAYPLKMEKRVEYDVWYAENWNFMLDMKIIFLTVVNMFKGEQNAF